MISFKELFGDDGGSKQGKVNSPDHIFAERSHSTQQVKRHKPWVEKYRPNKLDDVVYQDEVVNMLKETLKTGNLPHLLLHGQPGVGKTSTVLAIAMQLFGPRIYKDRVLELNASDERGINVVRNKIVTFAKSAIGSTDTRYPCPPYKIIILDEADAMTTEAQSALRKTLEDYAHITRFCFICNYINQIIDPIISRCVMFRFKPLPDTHIIGRLKQITAQEGMDMHPDAYTQISEETDGDLRKAIMLLQNLKYVFQLENNGTITKDDVCQIANSITDRELSYIKKVCLSSQSTDVDEVVQLVKRVTNYSNPVFNIMKSLQTLVLNCDNLTDRQKAVISIHMSKTEKRLIDGADEYLQLLSVFMCIRSVVLKLEHPVYN